MSINLNTAKFTARIKDPVGLHARPSSILVREASKFVSDITISIVNGKAGNLKSIISVMSLGAKFDDELEFVASGPDAAQAIAKIKEALLLSGLI